MASLPLAIVTASELNTYCSNLFVIIILIVLEAEFDIQIHNLSAVLRGYVGRFLSGELFVEHNSNFLACSFYSIFDCCC